MNTAKTLLLVCVTFWCSQSVGSAETILFESGTLGATGVTWTDLTSQTVAGSNISPVVFTGARFQLTETVSTTKVGGHFVSSSAGTFFGAIVSLDDASDFPDSGDLTAPDVLGHTLLNVPVSSADTFGDLDLLLPPGWYAMVFGSGLFDATTFGGAVRNGVDIGDPTYLAFQTGSVWRELSSFFDNHHFVVIGDVVPEPSASGLLIGAFVFIFIRRQN